MKNLVGQRTQALAQQFGVSIIPNTRSTGSDSPQVDYNNLLNKPASAAVPIYSGMVVSGGTAGSFFPSGWTVTDDGTGHYTVTHNLGTTSYSVVANAVAEGLLTTIYSHLSDSFDIVIVNLSNSPTDSDLYFILTTQSNP